MPYLSRKFQHIAAYDVLWPSFIVRSATNHIYFPYREGWKDAPSIEGSIQAGPEWSETQEDPDTWILRRVQGLEEEVGVWAANIASLSLDAIA